VIFFEKKNIVERGEGESGWLWDGEWQWFGGCGVIVCGRMWRIFWWLFGLDWMSIEEDLGV
jgi:hypothetical protein